MEHDLAKDLYDSFDDLLDREKCALLQGDLDVVCRLTEAKTGMLSSLGNALHPDADRLRCLGDKLEQNQSLLRIALSGIRAASHRLKSLREVRCSFDTYDSRGRKLRIEDLRSTKVERRA